MGKTFNKVRGVTKNQDLDPLLLARDARPFAYRMRDITTENGGFIMVAMGIAILMWPFFELPMISDLLLGIGLLFNLYAKGKTKQYEFKARMERNKDGKIENDGIIYLGNTNDEGTEIWFSNDDVRSHMLVLGTTGSGKTRFLLGLLYQALLIGAGCMYVDGKGDNTVWWLVYSLCRRLGREDDLLLINYLVGAGVADFDSSRELTRLSNTTNPLAQGTGEQLRSMIVGLMRDSGGDGDMWKGRASAMLGGLLKTLTYLRDIGEINLDVELIRSYLPLDKIVELAARTDIKPSKIAPIKKYLLELPGYTDEDALMGQIQSKAYEQHTYLTMQLTEVMADLSETYGHIFGVPLGEVDFKDVVFNRRILFVMLPALEKDPDALGGLGKLIVAGVRSALGPALGNSTEGTKRDVIDKKPTNSKLPFLLILDEYGYYSVKGFAVVAAQARSLGVGVVFAGQDYPSFKKGGEEEAASTVANTNITVIMKLQDSKETFELVESRGGEADITVTSGHENKGSAFSSYVDQNQTRVERRKRINLLDLMSQRPGAAHILFSDKVVRGQLFYADPNQVSKAYLNKFLMVNEGKKATIDAINGAFDKLNSLVSSSNKKVDDKNQHGNTDEEIATIFGDISEFKERRVDSSEACVMAIGNILLREELKDAEMQRQARLKEEAENPVLIDDSSIKDELDSEIPTISIPDSQSDTFVEDANGILNVMNDDERPRETVKDEAALLTSNFEMLLNETIISEMERKIDGPTSAQQKNSANPVNQLMEIEKLKGASDHEAGENAKKSIGMMSERIVYPNAPTPTKVPNEKIIETLSSLFTNIHLEKGED